MDKKAKYNVAVVGATGAVGRVMLSILEERKFPVAKLLPLASARSAGKQVDFNGEKITIDRAFVKSKISEIIENEDLSKFIL